MFNTCEAMKWNHLPVEGGIYDQDPVLLDRFRIIWSEKAKHEEEERKAQERKSRAGSRSGRRGR